ncbi:hypothetical protein GF361_00640 [Candidatus Woesearchaeota archaeon]|nr:hypothetical protein [Candidatus Woesearchaeota archaeon]
MTKLIKHSRKDRFFALLSYLFVLFLIPLFAKKDNKWIHQHAKQGFVLFLAGLLIWIPLLGWIWGLYLFVCWIIIIIKVIKGAPFWKIPIIGAVSEKIHI